MRKKRYAIIVTLLIILVTTISCKNMGITTEPSKSVVPSTTSQSKMNSSHSASSNESIIPTISTGCSFIEEHPTGDYISFIDETFEGVIREKLQKPTEKIRYEDVANIKELELYDNGLSNINDLQWFKSLEELYIYNAGEGDANELSDICVLGSLKKLKHLMLSEVSLRELNGLQYLENLEYLDLSVNDISDIKELKNLRKLTYLDLGVNKIKDISPLSNLINLIHLTLTANEISDISPLKNLTNLKELGLSSNSITDYSPIKNIYKNLIDKDFDMP
ncbi:MAG: leucine-rich repeat domain-containing protein [Saccharofermentanales bacterium]